MPVLCWRRPKATRGASDRPSRHNGRSRLCDLLSDKHARWALEHAAGRARDTILVPRAPSEISEAHWRGRLSLQRAFFAARRRPVTL